jgi:hypothetical protein
MENENKSETWEFKLPSNVDHQLSILPCFCPYKGRNMYVWSVNIAPLFYNVECEKIMVESWSTCKLLDTFSIA